jgi:hypothetical protein
MELRMGLIVKKPEKWRRCNACLSERQLRKIEMEASKGHVLSIHLCLECLNSLMFQVKHGIEAV